MNKQLTSRVVNGLVVWYWSWIRSLNKLCHEGSFGFDVVYLWLKEGSTFINYVAINILIKCLLDEPLSFDNNYSNDTEYSCKSKVTKIKTHEYISQTN